jgi:hypothetical protein
LGVLSLPDHKLDVGCIGALDRNPGVLIADNSWLVNKFDRLSKFSVTHFIWA